MRGLPDVGHAPFLTGQLILAPNSDLSGLPLPILTAGYRHGGKMPSSPNSLSSTLFALATGPTLPLPRQQLSCTLPKTQSSCMAETSLRGPVPYLLGEGLCSCLQWAVPCYAFPRPLVPTLCFEIDQMEISH